MLLLTWESILSSGPPPPSAESPPSSARPEAEEANISMNAEAAAKFGGGGSILFENLHRFPLPPRFHLAIPLGQKGQSFFALFPPLFRM